MTTPQLSLVLLIYTFIDAIDNPFTAFSPTARARDGDAVAPGW